MACGGQGGDSRVGFIFGDEKIVCFIGGDDKDADLGGAEGNGEGFKDADFGEGERAMDFHGAPFEGNGILRGNFVNGDDDGKFVSGAGDGRETRRTDPGREWGVGGKFHDCVKIGEKRESETAVAGFACHG
jgi:hypothetical protein